uniref:Uncharacterized protein n=1 Tax=Rhizophora mucronata TaxID=61149 RepID=A0A2P2PIA3_RHIMU
MVWWSLYVDTIIYDTLAWTYQISILVPAIYAFLFSTCLCFLEWG